MPQLFKVTGKCLFLNFFMVTYVVPSLLFYSFPEYYNNKILGVFPESY